MPTDPLKVLFVCTGNICRSPIAHRMMEDVAARRGLNLRVGSAGTRALNGEPMHPESARVLVGYGITPGAFESRLLTPDLAAGFDLVLGMTRDHRAAARQLAPARWKKILTLREMATVRGGIATEFEAPVSAKSPTSASLDIDDPIGRPGSVFDRVAGEIGESIEVLTRWIEHQLAARDTAGNATT